MKLLFMGTPDIAAACLRAVLDDGTHTVCGVFTRADKPVGRKQVLTAPPVKQVALAHNLPVFQPATLRDGEAQRIIASLSPDMIVVVAYGRILPAEILSLPPRGCINVHVSLLPKYRGAAPVQWAVLNGDAETGVSVMQMDEGLDTGDVLMTQRIAIGENETSGELFERVTSVSEKTLLAALDALEKGTLVPQKQNDAAATLAPPLKKEQACMDFAKSAQTLHNLVRGMNPWPVAYFVHEGKKVKVLCARPCEGSGAAGAVLCVKPLTVACGEGALILQTVVPEGKSAMDGAAWALGRHFTAGDLLHE